VAKISAAEAAAELLRRRAVRRSLAEFARSQGFEPAAHHLLLIDELERVERGDNDILVIEMPPGSSKSTFVNYLFPAWFLARHAQSSVLVASHSSELAERWGRKTRNLLASSGAMLGVSVSSDSSAAYRWGTTGGGEYYAVGVGVGVLGYRAGLGIVDDPFGSREDAESRRIRDKVWEWYTNDFLSRLKPGASRVIMHQRFHEDDLAGRLISHLDSIGKPYRRLKIRAEATDDDPLGRSPGEMLWDDPSGYDYGRFLRDRKAEVDLRTWSALYQQEPTPDTGDFFRREWIVPVERLPPISSMRFYGGSDYAVTGGGGDYTVHAVIGIDPDGDMYLVDLWRRQSASDEWVEAWCDLVKKWRPMEWAEETGQIRAGVGPFLDRRARERGAYCVRSQFPTRGDKAVRAQSIRGRMASRGLRVLASAPWRSEFEYELLKFPAGTFDDSCDAIGLVGQLLDKALVGTVPKPEKVNDRDVGYSRPGRDRYDSSGLTL
jgi:predicted phage terminase large subunit-like protein